MCKKGMLAAEATFKSLVEGSSMELYWENLKKSWIWEELHKARNYRPVCGYFMVEFSKQTYLWYLVKYQVLYAEGEKKAILLSYFPRT
jgi:flavin-dependent dehydrogenase